MRSVRIISVYCIDEAANSERDVGDTTRHRVVGELFHCRFNARLLHWEPQRRHNVIRSTVKRYAIVVRLFVCLFVCPQHNSKMNDLNVRVQTWYTGMILRYEVIFGVERLKIKVTWSLNKCIFTLLSAA